MEEKSETGTLVSVYMPTHQRGELVSRAIDSVLNQTYKNIELIVCVDGRHDETIKILDEYCNKDSRVSYIINETSHGACFARNRCIEQARGDFITGIDDDDEFTLDRVELFLQYANTMNIDIICAGRLYRNNKETIVGDIYEGSITLDMLGSRNLIGNQIFTKSEYLKALNGFDVDFPAWQDYDMWYRLIQKFGDCYKIKKPTYIFNVDDDRPRITTGSKSYLGYMLFLEKHKNNLTKNNVKELAVQDIINRGQEISLVDIFKNFTIYNLGLYSRYKLKKIKFLKDIYKKISTKKRFNNTDAEIK